MKRSSNTERARRVNAALAFIRGLGSPAKAATSMASQYGISKRQAYRYVNEAESVGKEISVPDPKIAFTVKLSQGLVLTLREYTAMTGQTLSDVVSQALEVFLSKRRRRGKKAKSGT